MSDDPSRPSSGPQSDPYPVADAPAWWGALGRGDLPLDGEDADEPIRRPVAPPADPPQRLAAAARSIRWRRLWFNALVLLVALVIVCVGVGVVSVSMFLTVALLFGVPLALSAATIAVVARRSR